MQAHERFLSLVAALIYVVPHTYIGIVMWGISEERHLNSVRQITMTTLLSIGCLMSLLILIYAFVGRTKTLMILVFSQISLWVIAVILWRIISTFDTRY